jgi:hypothetical protein
MSRKCGNPNWVKGSSGNPNGRPKGGDYYQKVIHGPDEGKVTECEVRERFRIMNHISNWYDVKLSQEGFPDLILVKEKKVFRVEVETHSRNFVLHRHDITQCDMIICHVHNWKECPVPVIETALMWENFKAMRDALPFEYLPDRPVKNGK